MALTHITPKNYKRYVGQLVVLKHPQTDATLEGVLIGMSSKGTTIELEDETRTTRRGWIVTVRLLTVNEVAARFGVTPTSLRYQLRKHGSKVGKGGRYGFDPLDVDTIGEWLGGEGL